MMNTPTQPDEKPSHPTFWQALLFWLKLGFISFGGPAGQIAIMHQELVEKRRWISERRFLHALNYCMVLPGPEAQQLTIYIGWLLHRTWGGIVAGALFVLPSLFILSALTYVYLAYGDLTFVQGVFNGIKPAVVAIVVFAAWRIGNRALKNNVLRLMAVVSFLAMFLFHVTFPYIVLSAGILGFIGGKWLPEKFVIGGGHGEQDNNIKSSILDDDITPLPHTRFRWSYLLILLATAFILWFAAMALLIDPVLHDMGTFFTKAALLTFGGAYAVLPYVYQGGVEQYQWLTGAQMIDGLALGETTPGPLIMIVSFVGFVGAWTKEIFGTDSLLLAGFVGACVATFFTFLPSFVFILAGAPLVESTHGNLKFTAPLTGITAAVVGVIVNLAVFFGWHVIFPNATVSEPLSGGFEWFYAMISALALIALWKFKIDIIKVIGVCAVVGLLYTYIA